MFKWLINWFNNFLPRVPLGIRLICRIGLPGCGKTLDQTESDILPHLIAGRRVKSCYWLNWNQPNLTLFTRFEEVEFDRNCVHVYDEVGQMFVARDALNEGVRIQMYFQLHRHRHIEIICNTQDVSLVAKTIGIVASDWIYMTNTSNFIFDLFRKLFGFHKKIDVFKAHLTWQQLRKMAGTWELEQVLETEVKTSSKHYSVIDIIHKELNEFKIELVHKYCPECCFRQGSQIIKEKTFDECFYNSKKKYFGLLTREFCPFHQDTFLEVRESGMYDTDYEPLSIAQDITLVPMKKSVKEVWEKYNGVLPENLRISR